MRKLGSMGKGVAAVVAVVMLFAGFASTASGFEGGGAQPSKAPLVVPGVHYFGTLNNHESEANEHAWGDEVAFWRLPPLQTRDEIVVSWHEATFSHSNNFPIALAVPQHANDANWGTQFGEMQDGEAPSYRVSGSGSSETSIIAQEPASDTYLEFYAGASASSLSDFEDYPYDFTVSGPLHYLSAAISPAEHVRVNGTISASVTEADGSPAPDGLGFTLTVSKDGEGIATYTATTSGGGLTFQLALPETLVREEAEFVVTRGADGTYQGVESAKMEARLAKAAVPPAPEPSSTCRAARSWAHALARSLHRLRRHAAHARSVRIRRRLHRRARHVAHRLRAARARAGALC